ncbi:MAG: hypothetical protein LBF74_13550 [Treponema sp.]|jgi:hypothetical protein|nr:hypothetical protein [Treponema sp.]
MINGIIYDFESIKVMLPTGLTLTTEKISYKDKKDDEVITGSNGLPIGIGRGEYSGECELELGRYEYDQLDVFAASSGGFYNMPPIPIVVSYGHTGQVPATDRLEVHFTERDFSGAKGDKNLKIPLKGVLTAPIKTNGRPAYVPGLN